jgi:hypothetical protein
VGMHSVKMVSKCEFIQHTKKYLQWVEVHGQELVITHRKKPYLKIVKINLKSFKSLQGIADIKIHEDINTPILPGYEEW